jgi:hypothetical protein
MATVIRKNATLTREISKYVTLSIDHRTTPCILIPEAMKNLVIIILVLLFQATSLSVIAQVDDCPCRPRRVKVAVVKKKVEPPKRIVKKHPLFQEYTMGFLNDFTCPRGYMDEVENLQMKIMPNPVDDILNIIYTTPKRAPVKIELIACDGAVMLTLLNEVQDAGLKVRSFELYKRVPRGIAYVKISAPQVTKLEQIFKL